MPQIMFDHSLAATKLAYMIDGGGDEVGRCGFVFLGGFKSDMTGRKAETLAELARATRRRLLRFDYSGHGQSSGEFRDGTISAWLEQATHMVLAHTRSKIVLVGSSMGGWLAQLLARRLSEDDRYAYGRIAGMVLLAPATDMTHALMWDRYDMAARQALRNDGVYYEPSSYGEPYEITAKLISDGAQHLLLDKGLSLPFPVRIIQGTQDIEVPPSHAVRVFESLSGPDVTLNYIKDADHRLSSPAQLRIVCETVMNLADRADGV